MKYTLLITETERYVVGGIEADSELEAFDKALEMMDKIGKENFHDDSNEEREVLDVE